MSTFVLQLSKRGVDQLQRHVEESSRHRWIITCDQWCWMPTYKSTRMCLGIRHAHVYLYSCRSSIKHTPSKHRLKKKTSFKACHLQIDFTRPFAGDANGFGMSLNEMHHSGSSWGTCSPDSPGCPLKLLLLLQGYQITGTLLCLQKWY